MTTDSTPLKVFSFFAASNYFRHKGKRLKGGMNAFDVCSLVILYIRKKLFNLYINSFSCYHLCFPRILKVLFSFRYNLEKVLFNLGPQ